jgi:hypothetical protein
MDQKFYAELKKGKFMESEIQISRGTYLSIKNFIFSVKKYTLRGFYLELEVFFCNYSANLIENML